MNSRYYNSEWERFINADGIVGQTGELLGHNLFAYCKNNPFNRFDPSGYYNEMAFDGISGGAAGGSLLDVLINLGLMLYLSATTEKSKADVTTSDNTKKQESYDVYVLVDKDEKAKYVGITKRGSGVRAKEHKRAKDNKSKYPSRQLFTGLTKEQARGIEQIAYLYYIDAGNDMSLNRQNPVSALNRNANLYVGKGLLYLDTHNGWDKLSEYAE